ncbi:hypothetical protein [Methylorubrum extorquens]|uniref:hypothetical protein n=1 Tax=Methylorubrum extorquens TaxID=408 RepID=UPI0022378766|nr:hypothetical protein [Methylorubrum extorquens]UYW32485.1 hypothetical protein OKB92_26565 [Methylorubrum extorquens]
MDDETNEELLDLQARCDGLTVLVGALVALLVRHRVLPDEDFTDALLHAEATQRMHNDHQALIETLRLVREMAEEAIADRDGPSGPPPSQPRE